MADMELIIRLFELIQNEDCGIEEDLLATANSKNKTISFFINCNDVFYWATSDLIEITSENISILEKSISDIKKHSNYDFDCGCYDSMLFCSRVNKMRPQNAMYNNMPKILWQLFDSCGDYREVDCNNPHGRNFDVKST